ncbi:MAG TPA: hypothetical protein VKA70_09270 [Blastocatellia bacterium]|nr:hypothetical protein [Blastocatellia bacterium]
MFIGCYTKYGTVWESDHMIGDIESIVENWLEAEAKRAMTTSMIWLYWPYLDKGQTNTIQSLLDDLCKRLILHNPKFTSKARHSKQPIHKVYNKDAQIAALYLEI